MKKIVLAIFAFIATATTASAQDAGEWSIAPKLNIYAHTGDGAVVGLGAGMRYSFTDNWRIEPSATFMLDGDSSVEIACDVHYVFHLSRTWALYPMAGLVANQIFGWSSGVDLGVGADFAVSSRWDITAAVKWQPMFNEFRKNPILISVGGSFRF